MKINADDLKWRGWFKQKARVAAIQLSCRLPGILQDFSWRGSIDPGILSTVSTVTAYAETRVRCAAALSRRGYLKIVVYDYTISVFFTIQNLSRVTSYPLSRPEAVIDRRELRWSSTWILSLVVQIAVGN